MPVWNHIQIANRDLKQVEYELNRVLRYYFNNIDSTQVSIGINDLPGILTLSKGGTGSNLSKPTLDSILYFNTVTDSVDWLNTGDSVLINSGVLDTVQDIRQTASPSFIDIILNSGVIIGDYNNGNYLYITISSISLYSGFSIVNTLDIDFLMSLPQDTCRLDVTGIVNAATNISTVINGANITKSQDGIYLGDDATDFNNNINLIPQYNGVELIKNDDIVYVSTYEFTLPNITLDSGDVIIIKG